MAKTNDEWELSKENIQPLQQGRTHGVLQVALSTHPEGTKIEHQRQAFEQELRNYSGEDPLSLWYNYIKWVEQNFPKGGRDGHIGKLIQRCLVILKEDKKYYDDKRFIQIWLKYASMTVKPIDIYDYMYSHNIGCQAAVLYTNWSWEVEQLGNLKKANKILLEGMTRKAEPFDQLKAYYSEFESRVARKVMTNPDNADEPNDVDCRSAFSVLKSGKKKTAPVVRTGENIVESFKPLTIGGQQPLPKRNASSAKVPFKIYNAENIQPSPLPIQSENATPFVLYSDQSKENEKKASKWNKVRAKQVIACPSISSATPDFKLHCDEGPQPASTPRSVPKVSNILQPRKDCDSPPMALFEPLDPKKIPMYDRKKVYGGGEEFSLEEIRAAAWHKKQKDQEMERKLAEQERRLKEQEEFIKNLKKQVDLLTNEKKLHTPSVSSKDNSQSLSLSRDSCVSHLMDLSDHSAVKGTIRKELFPENKPTSSYHEPTNVLLQELYNGTLCKYPETLSLKQELFPRNPVQPEVESFSPTRNAQKNELFSFFRDPTEIQQKNSVEEPSAFSLVKSSATSYSKPSSLEEEVPFQVFTDPTENPDPIGVKDGASSFEFGDEENIENKEDLENIPPIEYVQDMTKRELSGILEPSKNVFFIPLEEQKKEEEDEDFNSDEEIIHGENQPIQDVTIPPCNTEIFFAADICASTPRTQQKNMKRYAQESAAVQNPVSGPYIAAVETPSVENVSRTTQETISRNESIYKQSTYPYTNLSVILESSREGYKSSSSSGSSAGATQLSHFYSHDRTKLVSKMETFKEPLPPAQIEKDTALLTVPEKAFDFTHSVSDPFDSIFREQILQSLYKSADFNGIIKVSNKLAVDLKIKSEIIVGGEAYTVIKLIADNHNNGKVYEAICSNTPAVKVALKYCKQRWEVWNSSWEFHVCNTLHQRLQSLGPPDVCLSVVKPIAGERFSDSFIFVHEFCGLGTIYDLVNLAQKKSLEISELPTMCFTLELLLLVSKLHECEILHCDITPFNVLVQESIFNADILTSYPRKTAIIKLIDFSQAIDLKLFEKGTCFQTPQYDYCIEMREGKPWVHQLDWYGVLNCVHLLLFSDFMKVKKNPSGRWGIERRFKYQDLDIWPPLFDELLNLSCYQQLDIEKHIRKLESNIKQSISLLKTEFKSLQYLYK